MGLATSYFPFQNQPCCSLVSEMFAEVPARVNALLLSAPSHSTFSSDLHIQHCRSKLSSCPALSPPRKPWTPLKAREGVTPICHLFSSQASGHIGDVELMWTFQGDLQNDSLQPMCHNCWVCALEPGSHNYRPMCSKYWSWRALEPTLSTRWATQWEACHTATRE